MASAKLALHDLVEFYAARGCLASLPMSTLAIIVLWYGVGPSSGAGAAVSSKIFASEEQYTAAAAQLAGRNRRPGKGPPLPDHRQMHRAQHERRTDRRRQTLTKFRASV